MLPLRLVIDPNVIVSAALKPERLQRTTFLLAIRQHGRGCCDRLDPYSKDSTPPVSFSPAPVFDQEKCPFGPIRPQDCVAFEYVANQRTRATGVVRSAYFDVDRCGITFSERAHVQPANGYLNCQKSLNDVFLIHQQTCRPGSSERSAHNARTFIRRACANFGVHRPDR